MLVHGPAVVDVIVQRELGRREATGGEEGGSLEEIRRWEAKRRELKFQQESGEFVERAQVLRVFAITAGILRSAGEAIRVEGDEKSAKILSNAWDDVDAKVRLMFADDSQP